MILRYSSFAPEMQHNATAFPWYATIAIVLLALVIGSNPVCAAERPHQNGEADANAPAVSQQAILLEEDPGNPPGRTSYGLVVWRTALLPSAAAKQDRAVLAQITIPGRLVASLTLRPNTDATLAASHVIEITFDQLLDSLSVGISNVPGILMKESRDAKGVPLSGLAEKVKNSSFLIALSAANPQMQNNLQLLKDRDWFDTLIVYNNGKRAILVLQKGPSGNRAFAEAFSTWQQ